MPAWSVLRLVAIAIAVASFVDPAFTRARAVTAPLTIAAVGNEALPLAHDFVRTLPSDYAPVVRVHDRTVGASACPSQGVCVVVAAETLPDRLTSGAVVAGALRASAGNAPIIESISSPGRVSLQASAPMHVTLRTPGVRVEAFDGDTLVGAADAKQGVNVDLSWVPLDEGVRRLRVVAADDVRDIAVEVDANRVPILFYEPETTWLGTFVRRAVQDDGRFDVRGRTQVAPPVAISRGLTGSLTAAVLDAASAVVVSAADQLHADEVDRLERFVATRGGSLVVLLDRRPSGPILRLLPGIVDQTIDREPRPVGALRAAERVGFEAGQGTTVIDGDGKHAVTVAHGIGRGRVVASGALDAWRHRDATTQFDTYWTGLIWDAAVAGGAPLAVTVSPTIARPGQPIVVTARRQSMEPLPEDLSAEARYECGDERGVLRLWPEARPGVFTGTLQPAAAGECRVTVAINGLSGQARVVVLDDLRTPAEDQRRFEAAIAAQGGIIATAGSADPLIARLRAVMPAHDEPQTTYPMRSALWLVPFVGCLTAEWWLRRRGGLR